MEPNEIQRLQVHVDLLRPHDRLLAAHTLQDFIDAGIFGSPWNIRSYWPDHSQQSTHNED